MMAGITWEAWSQMLDQIRAMTDAELIAELRSIAEDEGGKEGAVMLEAANRIEAAEIRIDAMQHVLEGDA